MTFVLWVLLLVVVFWIFFPRGAGARFRSYAREIHPYSGLDPKSWDRFLFNMDTLEKNVDSSPDIAAPALYAALENIRDLGLGLRRADDGQYQDDLDAIAEDSLTKVNS